MNWNPFKRIVELEKMHANNIAVLSALTDRLNILNAENELHAKRLNNLNIVLKDHNKWLTSLHNQVTHRTDATRPGTPVGLTVADVEKEAKRRLQRAAYGRKYYAKKRAAKAAEGGAK